MSQILLLVDDEPNILQSLTRLFEDDDYTIYTATSGKDALAILEKIPVQVIISDQRMPNMTGTEFLTRVKQLYPNTMRIILSGFSDFNALKEAINNGSIYKFINKPWDIDALKAVVKDAFKQTIPIANNNDILKLVHNEPSMGLSNRYLFSEQLGAYILSAREHKQSMALVLLNIEGLNKIDDLLDEIDGLKVLHIMTQRLKKFVAVEADIINLGRDRFCLLFQNILKSSLDSLLTKLLAEINQPLTWLGVDYWLSATIGVSLFPDHGDTYYSLLKHAEYARAQSAKLGVNIYQIYNETIVSKKIESISELDILRAIEKNEFLVYYQPIVSAKTCQILGAEALVRWMHPQQGFLPPDIFIPLCEETGLIIQLGAYVLQKACEQLKEWHRINNKLFMSVNVSPRQLRAPGFIGLIKKTVSATLINPALLELELTENIMLYDTAFHIDIMQKINSLDIKLTIDDFGTGYSSLSYLKLLPITKLKIDKSFVSDIDKNKKSHDIIALIIALAKTLGLTLVAEGVETKAQLNLLKKRKCEQIQGYLFSKPVTAEDFRLLLETSKSIGLK